MGWHGSELLTETMARHPCGCDLAERAAEVRDPRAREVLERDAVTYRRVWGCVYGDRPGAPAPDTAGTIEAVARLVGAEPGEITGCPGGCVRRPEAHEALVALRWWRTGSLAQRIPWPTPALAEAIDLIDTSVSAREAAELRDARRKRERADG